MRTHYDVLGVTADVTATELKAAWRKAVRAAHPDTGGTAAEFQAVQDAYACLSDPVARAAYDRLLTLGATGAADHPGHDHPSSTGATWGTTSTVPPTTPSTGPRTTPPTGPRTTTGYAPAPGPATPPPKVKVPGQRRARRWVWSLLVLAAWYTVAVLSESNLATLVWLVCLIAAVPRLATRSLRAVLVLWAAAAAAVVQGGFAIRSGNWWLLGCAALALTLTQTVDADRIPARRARLARTGRWIADRVSPARRRRRDDERGAAWEHVRRLAENGCTVWFVVQADSTGTGDMAATATILAPVVGGPHTLKLLDGIHRAGTWVVLDRAGQVVFTTTEDARKAWEAARR